MSGTDYTALTVLGVDVGSRRIGLAIKPAGQDWALPRGILTIAGEQDGIARLRAAIAESGAEVVVVGLPLRAGPAGEGEESEQAREIRRFCRKVRAGLAGARWVFVDERYTSQAAESITLDRPTRGANRRGRSRGRSDDLAAKLILETFLQSPPDA